MGFFYRAGELILFQYHEGVRKKTTNVDVTFCPVKGGLDLAELVEEVVLRLQAERELNIDMWA